MEINGFWLLLAQLLELVGTLLSLPGAIILAISQLFYTASGVNNNGDNNEENGQE